jgi:ABC-type amino acid transport system permease subunit
MATTEKPPESQPKETDKPPEQPIVDTATRRRGRIGLMIPFERLPWWGIIILIVGVIVGYSILNNVRYVDALYFIFDLPWNRDAVGKVDIELDEGQESGTWAYTFKRPLSRGTYTIVVEFQDEREEPLGRSETFRIKVPSDAVELEDDQEPEPVSPSQTPIEIKSSTPTLVGTATPPVKVVVYDVRLTEVLYVLFDLTWSKRAVGQAQIGSDGKWVVGIESALEPGEHTLCAEFLDEGGQTVGRSDVYRLHVLDAPPDPETEPVTEVPSPTTTPVEVHTGTPTIGGTALPTTAVVYDNFGHSPWRVAKRIWRAEGVVLTLRVTLIAFSGAMVLGLVFGLMRVSNRAPNLFDNAGWRLLVGLGLIVLLLATTPSLRKPASIALIAAIIEAILFLLPAMPYTLSTLYVEVIRGIPMLVIVLYMGFAVTPTLRTVSGDWLAGLSDFSIGTWAVGEKVVGELVIGKWGISEIDLQGLPAAIIGLSFGYGAYLAEIYRAGIESIPRGQMEAARSLGMSYFHAMRRVILPQAVRVVLPPLGNDFIAMLKDSSLISVIALPELLQQGRLWISRNFRAFEGFNSVALLYLVMTLLLSLLVRIIERKSALPGC